jgi:cyclopropane fatty-acyl-phospholipid synthase-like methyltransferase
MTVPEDRTPRRPEELFKPETGRTYKEFWEKVAETKEGAYLGVAGTLFDQPLDDEDMDIDGEAVARVIGDTLAVGPDHKVLEIGVGVGRIAQHIAPRCGEFHGVDISQNMVDVASRRLEGCDNVHLRAVDRTGLEPYADGTFDRVYCQIVMIHIDREDVYQYMTEAFRVLKPGGRAWFQTNNLLAPSGFACFQGVVEEVKAQGQANRGRVHFLTSPELRRYVEGAGFTVREEESHLEMVTQRYPFLQPSPQWDHFLIAVAEKPA